MILKKDLLIYFQIFWSCIPPADNISLKMQAPINPYGKAKKMAEDIILDFSRRSDMAVMILRLVVYIT